jgi:hypothetical protein
MALQVGKEAPAEPAHWLERSPSAPSNNQAAKDEKGAEAVRQSRATSSNKNPAGMVPTGFDYRN